MRKYILLLLLSTLVGCGRDAMVELVAIDTLLQSKPDSAFKQLKDMNDDWLSAESEAYHALLYSQAQYKTFDSIEDDSIINIAVYYYMDGKDIEKRTRAYLYKGAVLAEMGLQREAINWYKQAEQVADTSEYLTLGLINTRLAELYEKSYIENGEDVERYKTALKYYRKANHKPFENHSLSSLAYCYTIPNKDSAYYYVNKSLELAKKRGDTASLIYGLYALVAINKYSANYQAVIDISNSEVFQNSTDRYLYKYVIPAYANLGKIDSAEMYLKYIEPQNEKQRVSYLMSLEQIALAKGDYKNAHKYCDAASDLADSIVDASRSDNLFLIEKRLDNSFLKDVNVRLKNESQIKSQIIIITALIIFILGAFIVIFLRRKRRLEKQKRMELAQLQLEMEQTYNLLSLYRGHTNELGEMLELRMGMLKKIMDLIYEFGTKPEIFFKKICQLSELTKQSEESCQQIIKLANLLNNNLIDYTIVRFPKLSQDELLLLALSCLNCTATEVCIFLQKSTVGSVYTMRARLTSKLGASSLEEYIAENSNIPSLSTEEKPEIMS